MSAPESSEIPVSPSGTADAGSPSKKLKMSGEELLKKDSGDPKTVNEKLTPTAAQKLENDPTECTECLSKSLVELEKESVEWKKEATHADMSKAQEVIIEDDLTVKSMRKGTSTFSSIEELTEEITRLTKSLQEEKTRSSGFDERLRSAEYIIAELSNQQRKIILGYAGQCAEIESRVKILEEATEVLRNENGRLVSENEDLTAKLDFVEHEFVEYKGRVICGRLRDDDYSSDEMEIEYKPPTTSKPTKTIIYESFASLMEHFDGFEHWPMLMDECKGVVFKFLDYKTITRLGMCSKADNNLVKTIPIHVQKWKHLKEHFDGFEYWPMLIDDCKEVVAKFLDYKTITRLGMCSKADYAMVGRIPYQVHSIGMIDNESAYSCKSYENVRVRVQFHPDYESKQLFELMFSQRGEDTHVESSSYLSIKKGTVRFTIEKSNYYEEAVKYAENWMKRCMFEMKALVIEMAKYPMETTRIKTLPKCKTVKIGLNDVSVLKWWLEKVSDELDKLQVYTLKDEDRNMTIPSDILSMPQIMNAKDMFFWCGAAYSDEQFLRLKAEKNSFDTVTVTDDGINQFLKNWANGKCVPGFDRVSLWSRAADQSRITRGLEFRPWDEEFRKEAGAKFCDRCEELFVGEDTFQISSRVEPFNSLTLTLSTDDEQCISIYVTGKKAVRDGKPYTEYIVPYFP